jgi:polyisoprenoid-binding protein YceI
MNKSAILVLFLAIFLAGCADPAANKPKATTSNTQNANTSAPKTETKGTALPITAENSKIEFTGSKVTGSHDGGFKNFTGAINLVNNKPEESGVSVEIEMNSVFTNADGLTKHLQTPDFFDVEKYPKGSFNSTKIVADAEKGAGNYTVTGDLNLHGTTKSITFPAKITVGAADVAVDAEFSINRKDFGIAYAGKADDLIRDDVVIKLSLKAKK